MYERTLEMSRGEIERYYRAAKHKRMTIGILADLNCCTKPIIKGILDGTIEMDGKTVYLDRSADRRAEKHKYYQEHKDQLAKDRHERYVRNRERCLEYSRQYNLTHDRSEYFRQRYQEKKAQKVGGQTC